MWNEVFISNGDDLTGAVMIMNEDLYIAGHTENICDIRRTAFIHKYSFDGQNINSFCINGDYAYSLIESSEGGWVVAGSILEQHRDALITKYTNSGLVEWSYIINEAILTDAGWDKPIFGYSVIELNGNGYVVVGGTNEDRIFLSKFTVQGSHIWTKIYLYSTGKSIVQDSTDDLLVTTGGKVLKLDIQGNILWELELPFTSAYAESIALTNDGNYIVAGSAEFDNSNDDAALIKISPDGNIIWYKYYDIMGWDIAYDVLTLNDGGYILMGTTRTIDGGTRNQFIIKTDPEGETVSY